MIILNNLSQFTILALYLYLHYALFKNPDQHVRIAQIDQTIHELNSCAKSQFGMIYFFFLFNF